MGVGAITADGGAVTDGGGVAIIGGMVTGAVKVDVVYGLARPYRLA
jgi:hypothetical protein